MGLSWGSVEAVVEPSRGSLGLAGAFVKASWGYLGVSFQVWEPFWRVVGPSVLDGIAHRIPDLASILCQRSYPHFPSVITLAPVREYLRTSQLYFVFLST